MTKLAALLVAGGLVLAAGLTAQGQPAQELKVQRGEVDVTGTGATITAGADYEAPADLSHAFIRIVNTRLSGGGRTSGGGNQNGADWNVSIANPANLLTSIDFSRYSNTDDTLVTWEIVEYVGAPGGVNEFVVRDQGEVLNAAQTVAGAVVSGILDDADVVPFITGQRVDADNRNNPHFGLHYSTWDELADQPTFTRSPSGATAASVSYAVVEFTGSNWNVQRTLYDFGTSAGTTQTTSIAPVDFDRAFIHAQNTATQKGLDDQGVDTRLTAGDTVTYTVEVDTDQVAVAWVVENLDADPLTGMYVQHVEGSRATGGPKPDAWTHAITSVAELSNASIMGETARSAGTGDSTPRGSINVALTAVDEVTLWQSDSGQVQNYSFDVVQWPLAPLPVLTWDGTDGAAWMSDHWTGQTPTGGDLHVVNIGTVLVQSDPPAAQRLTLNGGQVQVQAPWTLSVTEQVAIDGGTLDVAGRLEAALLTVGAGGTLQVSGTVAAGTLTAGGTHAIAPTAQIQVAETLNVEANLDMNGGTLSAAGATVNLAGGTLTLGAAMEAAALHLAGGSLAHAGNTVTVTGALTLSGSDLDMTGSTLTTAGAAVAIGPGRTLTVDNQTLEANSLDIQGALTRTGADRSVTVAESLNLAGDSLDMTGHTLSAAAAVVTVDRGRTLTVDNVPLAARTIDLSDGGTLDTSGNTNLILHGGGLRLPDVSYVVDPSGTFTAAWDNAAKRATALTLNGGMVSIDVAAEMRYSFDDPAAPFKDNSTGGYHDGEPQTTAPTWVAGGRVGGGVSFDANENGLRPQNWGFMEDECSQVTIAMWLCQDANTGNQMVLDEGGSTNGLGIVVNAGVLQAAVQTAGEIVTLSDAAELAPGWHHVAVVFGREDGLFELYLDGAVIDSGTHGSAVIATHTDDPGIGYLNNQNPIGADRYSGLMDELYYYERALTADEIIALRDGTMAQPDLGSLAITVNRDSGITSGEAWPLPLGVLTFAGDHTLTLEGPGVSFSSTILSGASSVTIDSNTVTQLDRDSGIDLGGADVTITKTGLGDLVLTRPVGNPGPGASKFVVRQGNLALGEAGLLDAAGVELAGGGLKLSSPAGSATQTYDKPVSITDNAALIAGKATAASEDAATVTYNPAVSVPAGKVLTLGSTDGYTLNLAGPIAGGDLSLSGGAVQLGGGATVANLSVSGTADATAGADVHVATLGVTGGTLDMGAHVVNVAEGGVMTLDESTYTATAGAFQVTGEITRSGAETLVLGGPGSVLTIASPPPATFLAASIGDDTNPTFPAGGSLVTQPVGSPTYTLTASGGDVFGKVDGCYFAYQEFDASQALDIIARVGINDFAGGTNAWRKAGVMIRNSLDANSRNGYTLIAVNNGNGINAQIRPGDNVNTIGATATGPRTNHDTPVYLRLTYEGDGNTFNMYWKELEGDDWTLIGTNLLNVALEGTIYAGLALTSHDTDEQTTIDFDRLAGFRFDRSMTQLNNLTGEGTVLGDVVIAGALAPGGSIGTIHSDSVTFADGSTLAIELDGADCDLLAITGDLTIGTDNLTDTVLSLTERGAPTALSYTLITWTGTRTGEFDDVLGLPPLPGARLAYHDNGPGLGGSVELVIPEPATLTLLALGALAAIRRRRR